MRHFAAPDPRKTLDSQVRGPRADYATHTSSDPYVPHARAAVTALFGPADQRTFSVRYWTGDIERPAAPSHGASRFELTLSWPGALRRMCLPPSELRLAEAFVRGDYDIRGDVAAAAALAPVIIERLASPRRLLRLTTALLRLPRADERGAQHGGAASRRLRLVGRRHDRVRDMEAIRHHYDVSNDFYALWLDRDLVYSCGYFVSGGESIDTAQRAKLDLICRKLRLRPGERLLDIGCGWGALIRHAARHYGVRALGVTLSAAQADLARARIAAEGLEGACRVEVRDYRDLASDTTFDKAVSVGMCEHVGRGQLATYFDTANRLIRPGGLFLNHCIVSLEEARRQTMTSWLAQRLWRQGAFIDRYVFPDGELATSGQLTTAAERAGFETRDVESLREHYALTLRRWVRRLEDRAMEASALVGQARYRVWRLYMAASEHAFSAARIGLAQTLFAKPDGNGSCCIPATRNDLYAPLRG